MEVYTTERLKHGESKVSTSMRLTPTLKNRLKEVSSKYKISSSEVIELLGRSDKLESIVESGLGLVA